MLRNVIGILFMAQTLGACAMLGVALQEEKSYRIPFGKQFLPYTVQKICLVWLIISLFINVLQAYCMK